MDNKFNAKSSENDDSSFLNNSSMVQNKKVVKHALRQQVKRRKKNTTIAAGNIRSLPRVSQVPSSMSTLMSMSTDQSFHGLCEQQNSIVSQEAAATMKEVLASLPGFSFKSNKRRSSKKLSTAAQLEAGLVDLESPASILSNISLRVLLNRHSFQGLPPLYQRKLAQLLPTVDRQEAANVGLNNEFFARACQEWRKRLAEGEFMPENQQRLRLEAEKDKNKLDPWKLKHFEPIWGEKRDAQKIKSAYTSYVGDQKYQKNIYQSEMLFSSKSDGSTVSGNHESFSVSLDNKIEQNILSVLDDVSNKASAILAQDGTDISEFNVTINILEEDEEDDDRDGDDDEAEDDECDDDDEDDEEDDDVDDDDSDDNYEEDEDEFYDEEDDVENDEFENQVTLTYLDEEAQHCTEILVQNDSNEEIYKQKLNSQDTFRNNRDCQEDFSIEVIEDGCVKKMDSRAVEMNSNASENDVEEVLKSSAKELPNLDSTVFQSKTQSECLLLGNSSKFSKPHDKSFSYQMKIHTYEQSMQRSKTEKNEKDQISCTKSTKNEAFSTLEQIHGECNNTIDGCTINQTVGETEVIAIDHESLEPFEGLKVHAGIQDTYEEISACSDEVIYPILEGMEMSSAGIKISETSTLAEAIVCHDTNENVNNNIQDEAFQEANNYVCSEMLDCQWESHSHINVGISNKEELSWSSSDKLHNGQIITGQKHSRMIPRSSDIDSKLDTSNYIQLPINQIQPDGLRIGTPISPCMMKNFQNTHNSSILSFPQIQSIRFVQTNFQTTLEHNSSESMSSVPAMCSQIQDSFESGNSSGNNEILDDNNVFKHINSVPSKNSIHAQNSLTHNTVVFQQQSLQPLSSRQLITTLQHQSHVPLIMNVTSRNNRTGIQTGHRFTRTGNKETSSGRSRNLAKEPPGAVNLERSYQICQAVIASSPNRDQLKAHLKPPPSLLTKNEKQGADSKVNSRLGNINKRKFPNSATTLYSRKHEASPVKRLFKNSHSNRENNILKTSNITDEGNSEEIECCKFTKKFDVDLAPRASSAPPMPPPIIAVNLFKGRPASAGERSHEVIALKSTNENFFVIGGSEPNIPDMIIGNHPPSPCGCNIQEAMVICRKCGAFCHNDCIGLQCVCATCLIP